MPIADDLIKTEIKTDAASRLLAVGLDGSGGVYLEISDDSGLTRKLWPGGEVRQLICEADDDPPTVAALHDGTLVICATQSGATKTFISRDDGEHWEGL